jgi:hypothetical protein
MEMKESKNLSAVKNNFISQNNDKATIMLTSPADVLVSNSYGNYNHTSGSLYSLIFEIIFNKLNVSLLLILHICVERESKQLISKVKNTDFYKHVIIQIVHNRLTFSIAK